MDPLPAARVLWLRTHPMPAGAGLMAKDIPMGGNQRSRSNPPGPVAGKPRHNSETKPIPARAAQP